MTNTHPDYGFYHTHVNRNAIASQRLVYDIITFFPPHTLPGKVGKCSVLVPVLVCPLTDLTLKMLAKDNIAFDC